MTMVTQIRSPSERISYAPASRRPAAAGRAAAHLATIKRFLIGIVTILAAGTGVATIMALKIAVYLPLFIHD